MKDMTLGQYFPGNSLLHRLDPRAKIIATVLYITAIFLAKNVYCFGAVLAVSVLLVLVSRISLRVVLRGIKPILFILAFTMIINMFFTQGETLLFSFWRISLYLEGIYRAILMTVRVVSLIVGTSVLLTYTTSPIVLTDAIESLLSPLKKIKIPVHDFAMMMTIALRFIPTLVDETDKIMNAQKARGADFNSGGLIKRAKALIPILVPLFVSSYSRAEELAVAMECRCYRGDVGRTKFVRLSYTVKDWLFLVGLLLFGAAIVLANIYLPIGFSV